MLSRSVLSAYLAGDLTAGDHQVISCDDFCSYLSLHLSYLHLHLKVLVGLWWARKTPTLLLLPPAVFCVQQETTSVFDGRWVGHLRVWHPLSFSGACHEIITFQASPILIKISSVLITNSDKITIFFLMCQWKSQFRYRYHKFLFYLHKHNLYCFIEDYVNIIKCSHTLDSSV